MDPDGEGEKGLDTISRVEGGFDREDLRLVALDRLTPDEELRFPIHGDDGVLLLAHGSVVTSRAIEILRQRGIQRVLVHREESAANLEFEPCGTLEKVPDVKSGASIGLHTRGSRRLDAGLAERIAVGLQSSEPPFIQELPIHGAEPYEQSLSRELGRTHEQFVSGLKGLLRSLLRRQEDAERETRSVLETYLQLMARDLDLFACVAAAPHPSHYPHRHSLHVAMLAMAIGTRAELSEEQLETLGLGALLHDIGMKRMAHSVVRQRGNLSIGQRLDIMQHPIYTVEALERAKGLADDVRYICYQVHERENGMGYPRQVPGELIHPLAKIVAIADTYIAMVSERPHRPGILPYRAMEAVLHQVKDGWFDPQAARWLLQTLSLFPVGSYVQLSDERVAKVVRANANDYTRPLVHVWPRRTTPSDSTGEIIDLREHSDLNVTRALPAPSTLNAA